MLIEFSEFNWKILILLIFPIFKRVEEFPRKECITKDNQLFKTFRYFLSYSLSFIPFLIIKLRMKKEPKKDKEQNIIIKRDNGSDENILEESLTQKSEILILAEKINKKRLIKNIIFIIVLCCIAVLCYYYSTLFNNKQKKYDYPKQSIGVFFNIYEYIALSRLILNQKLFKHHFVFGGIIGFIQIILLIITMFYMESEYILPSIAYYFFNSLIYGAFDVLKKKYMNIFYTTPYYLMFMVGIIDMVGVLIYESFTYILDTGTGGIVVGFQKNLFNVSRIFLFILDIILQWIWNIGIWLTIYYLTPCHYFISQYFSEYVSYLLKARDSSEAFYSTNNIVINSIAFVINFFCSLVFNEVLILNIWNLDFNTKKRIEQRISLDIDDTFKRIETELSDSFKDEEEENSPEN